MDQQRQINQRDFGDQPRDAVGEFYPTGHGLPSAAESGQWNGKNDSQDAQGNNPQQGM